MPREIVINRCYGGFGLSDEAIILYEQKTGKTKVAYWMIPRDDKDLVKVVRELGDRANGKHAKLKIVSIPDGVEWDVDDYDGIEKVVDIHRTWQ